MVEYPKIDLPPIPDDLDVRLQSARELERMHDESEHASHFFPVAHTAITSKARECVDVPGLVIATDLGVAAFEVIGHAVQPGKTYAGEQERALGVAAATLYAGSATNPELYMRTVNQALEYMKRDTPRLTDVLTEILGRYVRHDPVGLKFALQGAAAMRGMQIFIDKKIENFS